MTSMHVRHHYLLRQSGFPKDHENEFFTKDRSKMLRNKGVVYLSFHPPKSDVKAHGILYSESLVFCIDNVQKCGFRELLFCVYRLGC